MNFIAIESDEDLKTLLTNYHCSNEESLASLLITKGVILIDRRNTRDAEYTECDAQHDPDFIDEQLTQGDIF